MNMRTYSLNCLIPISYFSVPNQLKNEDQCSSTKERFNSSETNDCSASFALFSDPPIVIRVVVEVPANSTHRSLQRVGNFCANDAGAVPENADSEFRDDGLKCLKKGWKDGSLRQPAFKIEFDNHQSKNLIQDFYFLAHV